MSFSPGAALPLRRFANRRVLSSRPATALAARFLRRRRPDIAAAAVERWQVAPPSRSEVRCAKILPGQYERIAGAEFASVDEVVRHFRGGFEAEHGATIGYRIRDALLHDGIVYAEGAARHLRRRSGVIPIAVARHEEARTALYETWLGNRWFGNWLSDDCLTYDLAQSAGLPFTTRGPSGHIPAYERAADMRPLRGTSALFRDLVVFDDSAHNENKGLRAEALRERLVGPSVVRHSGVFLLRGCTGDARILRNERAIAEHLAKHRGFKVLDPSSAPLDEIVEACGGAEVIAGVEGSHLVHGLVMMPPGACAFVIQPPLRAVSALKLLTDRQGQDYALLVAEGTRDAFTADIDEIERTLDLL